MWAWGDNQASGLGFSGTNYGTRSIQKTPRKIDSLKQYASQIKYISGGSGWGQALLNDGRVIGWGLRAALGQGVTSTSGSSAHTNGSVIQVTSNVTQMHSRYKGTIALTPNNKVLTWGHGTSYPTIYGASVTERVSPSGTIVEVGGGREFVYYYRTIPGRIFGAGYGAYRQLHLSNSVNQNWPGVQIHLP